MRGGFGGFLVGKSDTPSNHMRFGAPKGYGPYINFAAPVSRRFPLSFSFPMSTTTFRWGMTFFGGTQDSTQALNMCEETHGRVSYFSPRFKGLQSSARYS